MADDEGLDFTGLSDDQIVGLASALAQEALRRNPATAAAFEAVLLDEKAKVEAMLKGKEKARQKAAQAASQEAERVEQEVLKEQRRVRIRDAMERYFKALAKTLGKPVTELTLVWNPSGTLCGRGHGAHLQINQGTTSDIAPWHLVDYLVEDGRIYTSPGARQQREALQPLCREASAAFRGLGLNYITVIQGIEYE